ncbi:collagen alpha-1(I) chain-like protein [Lates japonicus]|uniref:Collagen alpha-1(I) chain-like protein n=1 Tax=Lates japonicus TaxID=270547 RepID=A0AAD3MKM4_LATJO|nr:collagen alpha-1(I) chain-like protein [Lates japonicus]
MLLAEGKKPHGIPSSSGRRGSEPSRRRIPSGRTWRNVLSRRPLAVSLSEAESLLIEAQPVDGVRPVTAPVAPGSGLLGVGLFGNAAQSGCLPGGFNSAGQGRPLGAGGSPRGTSPRRWLAPAGRISSAGGAPRPALGRLGKARGEGGSRLRPRALQRPPARTSPLPGAVDSVLAAPSLPAGRDGAPSLPARLSTGADCPQCAPTASRRQGGDRPT